MSPWERPRSLRYDRITSPIFTLGFSLGMVAILTTGRSIRVTPGRAQEYFLSHVPVMNTALRGDERHQEERPRFVGPIDRASGNRLWNHSRNRRMIDTLTGTFVSVERIVGALEEFGRRFARLVIRESAGEMATDFLSLVFQF